MVGDNIFQNKLIIITNRKSCNWSKLHEQCYFQVFDASHIFFFIGFIFDNSSWDHFLWSRLLNIIKFRWWLMYYMFSFSLKIGRTEVLIFNKQTRKNSNNGLFIKQLCSLYSNNWLTKDKWSLIILVHVETINKRIKESIVQLEKTKDTGE